VAVLGSILGSAYRSGLHAAVVPAALGAVARDSVAEGVAVAHEIGSAALFAMVRTAFVHAMDVMLAVCAAIAVAGVLLALVFLPRRSEAAEPAAASAVTPPEPSATPPGPAVVAATGVEGTESVQPAAGGR
jgi:hypothetical protein